MNDTERDLLARLEAMPLEEARTAIHTKALGASFGSPNHDFCVSWLAGKDAAAAAERDAETLSIARKALANSRLATIIATMAMILSTITAIPAIPSVIKMISK